MEYWPRTAATDIDRLMSYSHNRHFCDELLLYLCHSFVLAPSSSIPGLHLFILLSTDVRRTERPKFLLTVPSHLVNLCVLFPSQASSRRTITSHQEVHLWISPAWDYFTWRLRCFRHRSPGVLETIPRHHQHPVDLGLELPHSILSRICACNGFS